MKIYAINILISSHPESSRLYGPEESIRGQYEELKQKVNDCLTDSKHFFELHGWGADVDRLDRTVFIKVEDIVEIVLLEL